MGEQKFAYHQTEVFEPIEVIVHFSGGNVKDNVEILRFRWRKRVYKVKQMKYKWKIQDNEGPLTCYTVISEGKIWELGYHHFTLKWELNQYAPAALS